VEKVTTTAPEISDFFRNRLQTIFEGWIKAPGEQAAREEASRIQILKILNGIINGVANVPKTVPTIIWYQTLKSTFK